MHMSGMDVPICLSLGHTPKYMSHGEETFRHAHDPPELRFSNSQMLYTYLYIYARRIRCPPTNLTYS
jgi:hypothetical protein